MLATLDFWTFSGWIFGIVSLVFTVVEFIRRIFAKKDADGLRSQLRSIALHLDAIQQNIAETHKADDVVKTDAGKRFLTSLAFDVMALRGHIREALGEGKNGS